MLGDKARALFGIAARAGGGRLDQHLHAAAAGDHEHAKAEPAAHLALDGEAEVLEEAFDGQIKRGFQVNFPSQLPSQLRCRLRDSVSESSPNCVGGFDQWAGERLPWPRDKADSVGLVTCEFRG